MLPEAGTSPPQDVTFISDLQDATDRTKWEGVLSHFPETPEALERNELVFLTRSPNRGRVLLNGAEVEAAAAALGFRIVDTDGLSLAQQCEIFGSARVVVGIHGAGLTNIIHRRGAPLTLLELKPPGYTSSSELEHMCTAFGYRYESVIGLPNADRVQFLESFAVDLAEVTAAMAATLRESVPGTAEAVLAAPPLASA